MSIAVPCANPKVKLPACSFVLPCLNEAASLPRVLTTINALEPLFERLDVIVVDNGSKDESVSMAGAYGARVIHCRERGYGCAVRAGIFHSDCELVVFADADDTYDWSDAPALVKALLQNRADLVVGSRLRGEIEPGSMPFLHRWVGTPLLSGLITMLYGLRRGVRVSDCNGGMRALRRSSFGVWRIQGGGMEFASEMIIRALQSGARYHEIPIRYRCGEPGRRPHLRPWRDGFRHLKKIFLLFQSH